MKRLSMHQINMLLNKFAAKQLTVLQLSDYELKSMCQSKLVLVKQLQNDLAFELQQRTRKRIAAALDNTHAVGERGPKTFMARKRLAEFLDGIISNYDDADVKHLEKIAKHN